VALVAPGALGCDSGEAKNMGSYAQFRSQVQSAYTSAMSKGLWANTSASTDTKVYWAVGTQVWFGANSLLPVKTRDALVDYDPPLAALLAAYLPADGWHAGCY
jgi:hypothetical protein